MAAVLLVNRVANSARSQVTPALSVAIVYKRDCHAQAAPGQAGIYHPSLVPMGRGGRSSFSGIVATVFGASSGFVGRYVVNRLGREGSQVIVPYRCDPMEVRHMKLMGDLGQITPLAFDARNDDSLREMMQHSTVVINLIGKDYETRNFSFEDVNIDIAGRIARIASELKIPRLIHMSALSAYWRSQSNFLRTKAAGEELVRKEYPNATILKPAQIYGREDKYFNIYARHHIFGGVPLYMGRSKEIKQPVYVADVSSAIMNCIKDRDTIGRTYELAGPHRYYLGDLIHYIYRITRRPYIIYPVPRFLLRMVASGFELSLFEPWLSKEKLERNHTTEEVSPGMPGLEDLGIKPTPIEVAAIYGLRLHRANKHYEEAVEEAEPIQPVI